MSRFGEGDDDAVELPGPGASRDPGKHAVATAVRSALTDDPANPAWTTQRLHQLAQAADRRADQRRRRRLVAAPALLLASAAAATALVIAVPPLLSASDPSTGQPAAGQDPATHWRGATLVGLTPADIQTVLPLALPLGPGPSQARAAPLDACGNAALSGVSAPVGTESAQWGTSSTRHVDDDRGGGTETTQQVLLEATVDTYADAAQAQAAADSLGRSVRTCTPKTGEQAPIYPYTFEVYIAPALYVSSYEDGVAEVTAVMVNGTTAATVHAWVPVAEARLLVTGSDQSVDPVPGADQASLDMAVMSIVALAGTAAQRAAGS